MEQRKYERQKHNNEEEKNKKTLEKRKCKKFFQWYERHKGKCKINKIGKKQKQIKRCAKAVYYDHKR